MTSASPLRVLICGGGVAGPTLAWWLNHASKPSKPIHVTIIERTPTIVKLGQGIDVEDEACEVVTRMGLLPTINTRTTGEKGFVCIKNDNKPYATFIAGGLTNEHEIMRGDLCEVLTNAVIGKPNVRVQYNRRVTAVEQTGDVVLVTISTYDGESYQEKYDAIIAADGMRSKTRGLMLPSSVTRDCIKTKPMFIAYFSIPSSPEDADFSRFQHAVRGRSVAIRPVTKEISSVYLAAIGDYPDLAKSMDDRDQEVRRQAWADTFADVTYGVFPRVIKEMLVSDNFYSDQIAQVKLPKWSNGRCTVLGDAGYAPAPITGKGTVLSMAGAYVLAGELASNPSDPAAAFMEYERKFHPYVEKAQHVPLGGKAPHYIMPQTRWGIWILQTILWLVAAIPVWKLIPRDMVADNFKLPEYDVFK